MARDSSAPRSICCAVKIVDDVAVEHFGSSRSVVVDVGDQMHLDADVLIFLLDAEFNSWRFTKR